MTSPPAPAQATPSAPQVEPPARDEPPPFGRSWTTLYLIVLANLGLWIAFLALFSRACR
jgi:hypothetical protein